jgi:16S rRNA A1518/A1519 N6-dimethyltransferase RsmA/KsgA/DIM1 with predicted DNA glycosylase/AP lyase activity
LFGFRRKQLQRAIRELTGWDPGQAAAVLRQSGLPEAVRPEVLSPAEYVRLLHALVDGGWTPVAL